MSDLIQMFIAGIIPPILILYMIHQQDLFEKEPSKLSIITFLLGALATIPMFVFEISLESIFPNEFLRNLLGIGLIEEGIKYIFIMLFIYHKDDFNEPYDGIYYSVVLTMGFALVENLAYILPQSELGMSIAILRMFTAIPFHATCGIIMGYFLGEAKMISEKKNLDFVLAIVIPTLIHGLYDYFLTINIVVFSLVIVFMGVIYAKKAIKIHQDKSPFKTTHNNIT